MIFKTFLFTIDIITVDFQINVVFRIIIIFLKDKKSACYK